MAKKRWFIIIISIIAVIMVVGLIVSSFPKYDKEEIEIFETYKEDFEKINEYILDNHDNNSDTNYIHLDKQIYQIVGLRDGEKIALDKETKRSLNSIVPAFKGYNFSFIQVSAERVSYGGEGYRMYVFSRDGKVPDYYYYYYKGDGMRPDVYELGDNWYLLKVNFR